MLRERPDGIRSVILDGSYPLDDDPLTSVPLTGADALERLFNACAADPARSREYPNFGTRFRVMVNELNREPALVAFVGGPIGGIGDGETLGTFLSVHCRDEVAFESRPPAVAENVLGGDDVGYVEDQLAACEVWDAGRAPEVENQPVSTSLPTLLLVGTFDPITPVEHGRAVATGF